MRLAHLLALSCIVGATPAHAAIDSTRSVRGSVDAVSAFAAPQMNDDDLARVVGTGGPGFRFLRDSTAVNARLVEQQSGLVLVTTFDNWFTDVGSALIFSNIAASR